MNYFTEYTLNTSQAIPFVAATSLVYLLKTLQQFSEKLQQFIHLKF